MRKYKSLFLILPLVYSLQAYSAGEAAGEAAASGEAAKGAGGGMFTGAAGNATVAGMGAALVTSISDEKWAQYTGAGLNVYAGYQYFQAASSASPFSWPLAAMGVMSYAQAGMTVKGALETNKTGKSLDGTEWNADSYPPIDVVESGDFNQVGPGLGSTTPSDFLGGINDRLDKYKNENGISISSDGKSLNIPGKGNVPMSAFGSKEGLLAAGFTEGELAGYDEMKKKMDADLRNRMKNMSTAAAAGGAGGAAGPKTTVKIEEEGGAVDPFANLLKAKNNKKREPASVTGMQKLYNGTLIGVKEDNIFEMIHRRYRLKNEQGFFIPSH